MAASQPVRMGFKDFDRRAQNAKQEYVRAGLSGKKLPDPVECPRCGGMADDVVGEKVFYLHCQNEFTGRNRMRRAPTPEEAKAAHRKFLDDVEAIRRRDIEETRQFWREYEAAASKPRPFSLWQWVCELFGGVAEPPPKPVPRPTEVPTSDYARTAVGGPAYCQLPIAEIEGLVDGLTSALRQSAPGLTDKKLSLLFELSLLGVCLGCARCFTPGELRGINVVKSMAKGDRGAVMFEPTGGLEHLAEGRCPQCSADRCDLFWCPDLNDRARAYLASKGINLDLEVTERRRYVWKPQFFIR